MGILPPQNRTPFLSQLPVSIRLRDDAYPAKGLSSFQQTRPTNPMSFPLQ
jgi:hypothetical protein